MKESGSIHHVMSNSITRHCNKHMECMGYTALVKDRVWCCSHVAEKATLSETLLDSIAE